MWEAQAAPGQLAELQAWILWRLPTGPAAGQLYRSADDRLVVIDPAGQVAAALAGVPSHLVTRPPQHWDFEPVGNV
jgi:hypothetical protein